MRIVKLTDKMLTHPAKLLSTLNATHKGYAFPGAVFVSKKDYDKLKQNTYMAFRKEYKYANKKSLMKDVGMVLLNLGPNQSLENVLKPGYAVIDDATILMRIEGIDGKKGKK